MKSNPLPFSPFKLMKVQMWRKQLIVFVRYIHKHDINNEFFLFRTPLKTTTRSADVFETISTFFDTEGLEWNKVCGVCRDDAPAKLGSKSGFQAKVKEKSPQEKRFSLYHTSLRSYLVL